MFKKKSEKEILKGLDTVKLKADEVLKKLGLYFFYLLYYMIISYLATIFMIVICKATLVNWELRSYVPNFRSSTTITCHFRSTTPITCHLPGVCVKKAGLRLVLTNKKIDNFEAMAQTVHPCSNKILALFSMIVALKYMNFKLKHSLLCVKKYLYIVLKIGHIIRKIGLATV